MDETLERVQEHHLEALTEDQMHNGADAGRGDEAGDDSIAVDHLNRDVDYVGSMRTRQAAVLDCVQGNRVRSVDAVDQRNAPQHHVAVGCRGC